MLTQQEQASYRESLAVTRSFMDSSFHLGAYDLYVFMTEHFPLSREAEELVKQAYRAWTIVHSED